MKIVVYCKVWKDGLGDFGHFNDVVDRILRTYGPLIEVIGLVSFDSQAHSRSLLEQDLKQHGLANFSWKLLDKPSREELDGYLNQCKDIKGIIAVSTPFYYSDSPAIRSLPILHIPEHEAASFNEDHQRRASIEFDRLIFSMGLHEASHGLLLKKYPSIAPETLLASFEDRKYRNLLLGSNETDCSYEVFSQFIKETLIVPLYVTSTTFAAKMIKAILVSELTQQYKNIVFHTNLTEDDQDCLNQLLASHCSTVSFISGKGEISENKFLQASKYSNIKVFLKYPLPYPDYEKLYQIAQEFAVGRGDKTLELIVSNPKLIPLMEVQKAKILTYNAFNQHILPKVFSEENDLDSAKAYISCLLYHSPYSNSYPVRPLLAANIEQIALESFLTPTFKANWQKVSAYLHGNFDFNPKLDFYVLLFFKEITKNIHSENLTPEQKALYKKARENTTNIYQFAYVLLQMPEADRKSAIDAIKDKITNSYELAALFILLPEEERYEFLKYSEILNWNDKLAEIFLYFLPHDKRWNFYHENSRRIVNSIETNLYAFKAILKLFTEKEQWSLISDFSDKLIYRLKQGNCTLDKLIDAIPVKLRLKFISSYQLEIKNTADILKVLSFLDATDKLTFFNTFTDEELLALCQYNIGFLIKLIGRVEQLSELIIQSSMDISEIFKSIDSLQDFLSKFKEKSNRESFIQSILNPQLIKLVNSNYDLAQLCKLFSKCGYLSALIDLLREEKIIQALKLSIGEKNLFKTIMDYLPEAYCAEFMCLFGGIDGLIEKALLSDAIVSKLCHCGFDILSLLDQEKYSNTLASIILDKSYPLTKFRGHSSNFINALIVKLSAQLAEIKFSDHSFMVVFSDLSENCHETLIRAVGAKKIVQDIGDRLYYIDDYPGVKVAYLLALKLAKEPTQVEQQVIKKSSVHSANFFKKAIHALLPATVGNNADKVIQPLP